MPGPLKNIRHERFAILLKNGATAEEAYEKAGYKPNPGNAQRLKCNEVIKARVAEFQAEAAKVAVWTRADILRELKENADLARKAGQTSAANQALQLYGKELGMFVDRRSVDLRVQDMSEEEILEFLGSEPDAEEIAKVTDPAAGNA